jgi:hypothetical protein
MQEPEKELDRALCKLLRKAGNGELALNPWQLSQVRMRSSNSKRSASLRANARCRRPSDETSMSRPATLSKNRSIGVIW